MRSDFSAPINIGSEEMLTIDQLVDLIAEIANKKIEKHYVQGPIGVRGRKSDNRLIKQALGWAPSQTLRDGLVPTYSWIHSQAYPLQPKTAVTASAYPTASGSCI
jgi:nucleoside-diphosphate-sugar epimerase